MSVPYLKAAAAADENEKLVRFVRLHLGDGSENAGRNEIDRSWAEAIRILLKSETPDYDAIERILSSDEATLALLYFHLTFTWSKNRESGSMTEVAERTAADPRETGEQLRAGLWQTINERYPGSMVRKDRFVAQAKLQKPLNECRVSLVSSSGVHLKTEAPLDVCHPLGDFRFRRVPASARHDDLIIHQLKFPHDDADLDVNVIFPIERLQELAGDGTIGSLTSNFFSFIGYNMDPERFERETAQAIAAAVEEEKADVALLVPA